ncbi:MAG: phosphoribosyl-AMP cyclohydrolase [Salinisphaeraceae bacterium]
MNRKTDWLDDVAWNGDGLAPAVVQDATGGRVLMMAWMNRDSLAESLNTGFATFWSRSRGKLWRKGESSGHRQRIVDVRLDCDSDTLLLRVEQVGGIACHTGRESCFYRQLTDGTWQDADPVIRDPEDIYG